MAPKTTQRETAEVLDAAAFLRDLRRYIATRTRELNLARDEYERAKACYEELEADMHKLRNEESDWARRAGEEPVSNELQTAAGNRDCTGVPIRTDRRIPYGDLAKPVLEEAGRELTTNEIVRALIRKGHIPHDEEHRHRGAAYSSIARRKQIFKRVGGYWDLVGRSEHPRVAAGNQSARTSPSLA